MRQVVNDPFLRPVDVEEFKVVGPLVPLVRVHILSRPGTTTLETALTLETLEPRVRTPDAFALVFLLVR